MREYRFSKRKRGEDLVKIRKLRRQKKNILRRKKVGIFKLRIKGFFFLFSAFKKKKISIFFKKKKSKFFFLKKNQAQPDIFFKNAAKAGLFIQLYNFYYFNFFFFFNNFMQDNSLVSVCFLNKVSGSIFFFKVFFFKVFFFKVFFFKVKKLMHILNLR